MIQCSKFGRGCQVGWYHLACLGKEQDEEVEDGWTCGACLGR